MNILKVDGTLHVITQLQIGHTCLIHEHCCMESQDPFVHIVAHLSLFFIFLLHVSFATT
jgi:hypothetical protein